MIKYRLEQKYYFSRPNLRDTTQIIILIYAGTIQISNKRDKYPIKHNYYFLHPNLYVVCWNSNTAGVLDSDSFLNMKIEKILIKK